MHPVCRTAPNLPVANFRSPLRRSSIRLSPDSTPRPAARHRKQRGRPVRLSFRFPMQTAKVLHRCPPGLLLPCRDHHFLPWAARRVHRKRGRRVRPSFRASRRCRRHNLNRSRRGHLKGLPMSGRQGRSMLPFSRCRPFSRCSPDRARRQPVCKTDRQHRRSLLSKYLECSRTQVRFPGHRPHGSLCRKLPCLKRMRPRIHHSQQSARRGRRKMRALCQRRDPLKLPSRARPRNRRLSCLPMGAGGRANCRANCAHRSRLSQGARKSCCRRRLPQLLNWLTVRHHCLPLPVRRPVAAHRHRRFLFRHPCRQALCPRQERGWRSPSVTRR